MGAGNVARLECWKSANIILASNVKGRDYLRDLGLDGRILLT